MSLNEKSVSPALSAYSPRSYASDEDDVSVFPSGKEHRVPMLSINPQAGVPLSYGAQSPSSASTSAMESVSNVLSTHAVLVFWIAVNCIATLAIVLVNKIILNNHTLRGAPILFVAYHFFLTSSVMQIASSGAVGLFERKTLPVVTLLPLCIAFGSQTIITNWSLALLDVSIYQELRILLTPATVLINLFAYRETISQRATLALVVVCGGIAFMIYADAQHKQALAGVEGAALADPLKNTSLGYMCGLGGVFLSSLYTVWVGIYHHRLQASSLQLLQNQAPIACLMLLVLVPFLDEMPDWGKVTQYEWGLLLISGFCAVCINVSQFFIVAGSSAVTSTVVGHGKTCLVVAVGWYLAGSSIAMQSWIGIITALIGIFWYSAIGFQERAAR